MTNNQMNKYIFIQETKSDSRLFSKKVFSTITALIVLCIFVMTAPAVHAEETSGKDFTVSDTGMDVASGLATVVYFPAKAVFALGGGLVGGLTYAFTGGNEEATNKVWDASMKGDYRVTPENLTGEKPLRFVGP
jgi:hypothetical protein